MPGPHESRTKSFPAALLARMRRTGRAGVVLAALSTLLLALAVFLVCACKAARL